VLEISQFQLPVSLNRLSQPFLCLLKDLLQIVLPRVPRSNETVALIRKNKRT